MVPSSGSESLVRFVPSTHEASHLAPSPWMCPACPRLEVHAGSCGSGDYENTHHITWVSAGSWGACDARNSWKTLGNKQTQIKTNVFFFDKKKMPDTTSRPHAITWKLSFVLMFLQIILKNSTVLWLTGSPGGPGGPSKYVPWLVQKTRRLASDCQCMFVSVYKCV